MKYISVSAISFLILGCASQPTNPSLNLKTADNIAVISVMDAPANPLTNADQIITQEMLSSLKNSKKNSFALQVDQKVVKAERDQALALKDIYLGNRYQTLQQYFLKQAHNQSADYLLVVHPSPHPQFANYTPGYGLHCSPSESQAELHGYFLMSSELWDVQRQEIVARVQLSPADLSFNTGKKCNNLATSKDLANSYRNDFTGLAKKSSSLILSRSGILN